MKVKLLIQQALPKLIGKISKLMPVLLYATVFVVGWVGYKHLTRLDEESPTEEIQARPNTRTNDVQEIQSWHLFGAKPQAGSSYALKNLKLVGIVFEPGMESRAIIMMDNHEILLKAGDKVDRGVKIQKIEPTKITLQTPEGPQTLELFEGNQHGD